MQRFGTASVPTHSIGLALLKSEWQKAVDMILQKRYGEHPEVEAARDAWLVEGDLEKALSLFPRRVIAERCILESFKKQKGDTRNVMGALSTASANCISMDTQRTINRSLQIPRNLRLMYIHAYQSYVWNAIVSERIRTYGCNRPIVGDLVFETTKAAVDMDVDVENETSAIDDGLEDLSDFSLTIFASGITNNLCSVQPSTSDKKARKSYVAPRIRTLTEDDLDNYTIFDVIMPLPGTDVAYPGGKLGERYREFLRMDGLDPDNFVRKQKWSLCLFLSYIHS